MIRVLFLLLIATLQHHADTIDPLFPPLFASVTGVAEDDVLNVREKPDNKAKKVASLPSEAYVGIDRCQKVAASVWCRVYHMAQYDYEGYGYDAPDGWVNAHYLHGDNRGYVLIDEKGNCAYALKCQNGECEVVSDYEMDSNTYQISTIHTQKISRKRLKGDSNFGAAKDSGEDGYCTNHSTIEVYFIAKKLEAFSKKYHENAYLNAQSFLKHLVEMNYACLEAHFDPELGVVMTEMVSFSDKNRLRFMRKEIKNIQKTKNHKIYWGKTYGKGDDIWMSLYAYMNKLTRPLYDLSEVQKIDWKEKGFNPISGVELAGYEFIWRDEGSKEKEYTWLGLVVIMGKKHGTEEWYVVGILRDRWTI